MDFIVILCKISAICVTYLFCNSPLSDVTQHFTASLRHGYASQCIVHST